MQKILSFELATAVKDRSKAFRIVTLTLFSFCLTVILIASVVRFYEAGKTPTNAASINGTITYPYLSNTSAMSGTMLVIQK